MAGFMLAALTIMITFRANIKIREPEKAKNSLELILGTHYTAIVSTFKVAIFELVFAGAAAYFVLLNAKFVGEFWLYQTNVVLLYAAIASVTRSFIVLSKVLDLDK